MPAHQFNVFCRRRGCRKKIPPITAFYCAEHAEALIFHLDDWIHDVMKLSGKVYLGRTNHPERRLLEHHRDHGRDQMAILHWASDWDEADAIESMLIDAYSHKAKLQNATIDPAGRHSGAWNAIYVSWAWKASERPTKPQGDDITTLCWRKRAWPDDKVPMEPHLMRTTLPRDEAKELVSAWWESLRQASA